MKIKILSDSTCDLSQDLIEQNNIGIVPLIVIKDGEAFSDGVTITPDDIFAHVAAGGSLCSTAAVNVGSYADIFAQYRKQGIEIIGIESNFYKGRKAVGA